MSAVFDIPNVRQALDGRTTRILAVLEDHNPGLTRRAVSAGAHSLMPINIGVQDQSGLIQEAIKATIEFAPPGTLETLAVRLDEPLRPLVDEERRFLELLLTISIEASGREVG